RGTDMAREPEWIDTEGAEPNPRNAGPDLLTIAWRRKSIIALGCVVGLALGYLYFLKRPAVYQSAAQLLVVKKRPAALPIQGIEGQVVVQNEDFIGTHMVLIKSPLIISRAAKRPQVQ